MRPTLARAQRAVFDRALKTAQRNAAALSPRAHEYDYLRAELAERLADRLDDVKRSFPYGLDVGAHAGFVRRALAARPALGPEASGGCGGVETLVQLDGSEAALERGAALDAAASPAAALVATHRLVGDEEDLPFDDDTFDVVTSSMALNWTNDLPRALSEIRRVLKPDGAFVGAMLGGHTLSELGSALAAAELEREGGVSVHTSPAAHVGDVGGLLQGAGFALPTVDVDHIECRYSDAFMLMEELQGMGEQSAALERRDRVSRDTFLGAAAAMHHLFGDGESVPATFDVLWMIGWKPADSQPRPMRRGSASGRLGEAMAPPPPPPPAASGK